MKKNIKKIAILSVIALVLVGLIIGGIFAYFNFKPYNTIKEQGVSFKYPKGLEIKKDKLSQDKGYILYSIKTKFIYGHLPKESLILIQIPTKDNGRSMTLSESIERDTTLKPEDYLISLRETTINGNKGMMVKYRDDRTWPGEPPMYGFDTIIHLESKYKNSPVALSYNERDTDPDSLDEAWEMILTSLKF